MDTNNLKNRYKTVCEAPSGNGFRVEHMPELLLKSDIDDCSPHVHSFYEILWFQSGHGKHIVDFTEYDVKPNTIFFLSPGQIHHFDCKEGYTGLAIKMCTDFMRDSNENANAGNSDFLKYNIFHAFDTIPYYIIDTQTAQILQTIAQDMEVESQNSNLFGNIEILKSLLQIFLVKTMRHGVKGDTTQLDTLRPGHQLFVKFRQMVEQEYKQIHTVQEYADALNVAVRTLNKAVNECSNKSPLAFINDRIMLEAKRLVRYTNLMFKEIAYELGYEDPSYFVKLFKRQTGYLPSDFRELDQVAHCKAKD